MACASVLPSVSQLTRPGAQLLFKAFSGASFQDHDHRSQSSGKDPRGFLYGRGTASGPDIGPELAVGAGKRTHLHVARPAPPRGRSQFPALTAPSPGFRPHLRRRRSAPVPAVLPWLAAAGLRAGVQALRSPGPSRRMPARSGAQFSRRMGQKKQRPARAGQPHSSSDAAQAPCPREPCLGPPTTPGPYRSIYFSSRKGHLTRLGLEFFDQPAVPLARAFLGQVLVRRLPNGTELRGRIVETEAYLGPEDEAAHSRGGRQTPRNRGMFMKPGTLYVYIIYGMYFCMNISSQGDGACVLLRALEPLEGLETMRQLRSTLRKGTASRVLKDRELCSGPSKLCQALAINKSFDQRDLAQDEAIWLERGPLEPSEPAVVAAARVGVGHAGEWARKPLRFYIRGSPWVSVVDRAAEQDTQA
ncbi:DNA-3-methyladenine glycosylase isoform X1 [Symphalangus syndactylus]|uniref:DNA-3-methyladenine glycosylase isoform X1 n=2 Tax=Symphalangus syndactylus TaxID=9590 RepID=UPI0030050179